MRPVSETASAASLYAYLEPLNEAASNLSYAAFFITNTVEVAARGSAGQGIPFASGELTAVSDALIAAETFHVANFALSQFVVMITYLSAQTLLAIGTLTLARK